MKALQVIELFAGIGSDGKPVVERLPVSINEDNSCQLVKSPAFIKGIASGDTIKLEEGTQNFELIKRSGNLAVRVYSREDITEIATELTPQLEKLGGEQDVETPRMLVYSIHVSCGFKEIEELLNSISDDGVMWMYGNVYDPQDGTTPLNWWQSILNEQ